MFGAAGNELEQRDRYRSSMKNDIIGPISQTDVAPTFYRRRWADVDRRYHFDFAAIPAPEK